MIGGINTLLSSVKCTVMIVSHDWRNKHTAIFSEMYSNDSEPGLEE